jgi:dephospho-CoA kinase
MAYTVGLTGNIACGKSTVGRMLIDLGADYVDTDAVVHQILANDTPQAREIVQHFGPSVAAPNGGIIRSALGSIVFADPSKLRALERILYPGVEEIVHDRIHSTRAPLIVIDGVRIFESGLAERLDELWVVVCSEDVQRVRLANERGMAPHDIDARLGSQPALQKKLARADLVIDNSGELENTRRMVEAGYRSALKKSRVSP